MSQSLVWHVPTVNVVESKAEGFTQEEMQAWEMSKASTFEWLYDMDSDKTGDNTSQLQWKKHVAYLRKMLFENVDLALYDVIEAVRKGRWEEVHPSVTILSSNAITVPVPVLADIQEETEDCDMELKEIICQND